MTRPVQKIPRLDPAADRHRHTGTVVKKELGTYFVEVEGRLVTCKISSRLRKQLVYPTADRSSAPSHRVVQVADIGTVDPVAIGDKVELSPIDESRGVIRKVLPRRNRLGRLAPGRKPVEQVIVANLDQVIPVFAAAQPTPKWNLLDRYLVAAQAAEIPATICITKIDLVNDARLLAELEVYERIGYPVIMTSAKTHRGIHTFHTALAGRRSVFVGKSGVGKTSLLNALQPGLGLRVREVSAVTGKGKHATSHLEMFPLDAGGSVVDTPGMREFSILDPGDNLALFFPEMRPHVGLCRFGASCTHRQEPGCAIRGALDAGEISERRYRSFLRLS